MQIPAPFYGLYREVKPRMSKVVTQMRRGRDWIGLMEAEGMLDVATTPGMLVLRGPSPILFDANFHMWLPWLLSQRKEDSLTSPLMEQVFADSLARPWTLLGLIAGDNFMWFSPRARFHPFLNAVRRHWPVLYELGARYSNGVQVPEDLWSTTNNVHYVLGNQGIDVDVLQRPLPPGGIDDLISEAQRHLH
jgi:hypothetical protein